MEKPTQYIDKPLTGMAMLVISGAVVVGTGVISRLLVEDGMHPLETVFYRNIIGFIIAVLCIAASGKKELFTTERPKAQIFRAVIGNICVCLTFWAYAYLPVATVSSILLTSPIFVVILSPLFLGEKVKAIRWFSVLLGLCGALIIIQPGTESFSAAHIIALLGALAAGCVSIMLRDLGKDNSILTTMLWMYGIGIPAVGIAMPFVWTGLPSISILLFAIALASFISQIFKTGAFKYAEASLLSPFKYFNIVWATFFGLVIWQEIPEIHVYIGCGIIIASNLIILWRERGKKTRAPVAVAE